MISLAHELFMSEHYPVTLSYFITISRVRQCETSNMALITVKELPFFFVSLTYISPSSNPNMLLNKFGHGLAIAQ